jgi:hypothetical protein
LFHADLFDHWVGFLVDAGVLRVEADGTLGFDRETLEELAGCLAFVLPAGMKLTLQNLAGAVAEPPSGTRDRRISVGESGVRRSSLESGHSQAE